MGASLLAPTVSGVVSVETVPHSGRCFAVNGKSARTVMLVTVEAAFFHCSKAIVRSDLWNPQKHLDRSALPTAGAFHKRLNDGQFDAETYDREAPVRVRDSLY